MFWDVFFTLLQLLSLRKNVNPVWSIPHISEVVSSHNLPWKCWVEGLFSTLLPSPVIPVSLTTRLIFGSFSLFYLYYNKRLSSHPYSNEKGSSPILSLYNIWVRLTHYANLTWALLLVEPGTHFLHLFLKLSFDLHTFKLIASGYVGLLIGSYLSLLSFVCTNGFQPFIIVFI